MLKRILIEHIFQWMNTTLKIPICKLDFVTFEMCFVLV